MYYQAWLAKKRKGCDPQDIQFIEKDAKAMEREYIQKRMHLGLRKTLRYIAPQTPCRYGITAPFDRRDYSERMQQMYTLYGFPVLNPAEIHGAETG